MYKDPIIEEVWRLKEEYAQKHGNNAAKIFADLRRREKLHPERVVEFGTETMQVESSDR
jgi:hypothetical protein